MTQVYFNHAMYNRWYRQYNISLRNFMMRLDSLRLSLATLPPEALAESTIEHQMDEMDEKVQEIIPRDFEPGAHPLSTSEVFVENIKVVFCVIAQLFHIPCQVESIYEKEKKRVSKIHHRYKFKEKLLHARKTIQDLLAAYPQNELEEEAGYLNPPLEGRQAARL